jgi:putative spermidine/putrescine transport system permease protein
MRGRLLMLLLLLIFLAPLGVLVLYSLSGGWSYPALLPERFSLRALQFLAARLRPVASALLSSTAYSLITVLLTFALSLLPARALARFAFPGRRLLDALLLVPALLPSMTFSMGIHLVFLRVGLSDSYPGVILVLTLFSYPYMLRALIAGYLRIPEEYSVTARNLGGGFLRVLLRVEVPMLLPAAAAGGSVVFLAAFSEYFLVFLIGGGAVSSYTGYLFPFLQGSDHALGSLLTLVFLIVPLALFFLLEWGTSTIYRQRGFA